MTAKNKPAATAATTTATTTAGINYYDDAQIGAILKAVDDSAESAGKAWLTRADLALHIKAASDRDIIDAFCRGYAAAGITVHDDKGEKKARKAAGDSSRVTAPKGSILLSSVESAARKAWGAAGLGMHLNAVAEKLTALGIRADHACQSLGHDMRTHGWIPGDDDSLRTFFPKVTPSVAESLKAAAAQRVAGWDSEIKVLKGLTADDDALRAALAAALAEAETQRKTAAQVVADRESDAAAEKADRERSIEAARKARYAAGFRDGDYKVREPDAAKAAPVGLNIAAYRRK